MSRLLPLLLLFLGKLTYANNPFAITYKHLLDVNKQWQYHTDAAPSSAPKFVCDNDRIQFHLQMVEKHLREHTPQGFSEKALRNRMELLDVLHQYHTTAIFPTNTGHAHRQPYFIDDYGVYCAVGYLISKSGNDALAQEIHRKQNYAYIKEITVDGVLQWADEYGFTIDELAWIQPGYMANTSFAPLGDGTDAPVDNLYSYGQGMVFTGTFNQVNGLPCAKIGRYYNGNLSCIGNGIDGTVKDIGFKYDGMSQTQHVYAAGKFMHNGNSYPIAVYDNNDWNYISMTQVADAKAEAIRMMGNGWLVAISYPALVDKQEIWFLSNSFTWTKKATINGVVKDIEGFAAGHVIAGAFNSVMVHTNNGNILMPTDNIVFVPYQSDDWQPLLSSQISDTVLAIKYVGDALYFAGTCSPGGNEVCLTRYYNQTLQPLVTPTMIGDITNPKSINTVDLYNNTDLLLGGDFIINGFMYSGQNLALYNLTYHSLMPHAVFNQKVTGVAQVNNEWLVGGHFTENLGTPNLNHLAKIVQSNFSVDEANATTFTVYPNPASETITAATSSNISTVSVLDLTGKEVIKYNTTSTGHTYQFDISMLTPGMYIMVMKAENGASANTKFLVSR